MRVNFRLLSSIASAENTLASEAQPSDIDCFQIARSPTSVSTHLIGALPCLSTPVKLGNIPSSSDSSSNTNRPPSQVQAVDIISLGSSKIRNTPNAAQCPDPMPRTSTASIPDMKHDHSPDEGGIDKSPDPSSASSPTSSKNLLTNSLSSQSAFKNSSAFIKRLSGEPGATPSLRQKGSVNSTIAVSTDKSTPLPVSRQGKNLFAVQTLRKQGTIRCTPLSTAKQSLKSSQGTIGRKFFCRLSNNPGRESKSTVPTSSPTPISPRPIQTPFRITASLTLTPTESHARTVREFLPLPASLCPPNSPARVAENGQDLTASSRRNMVLQTKPGSNTVNAYSPSKRSPLSQSVITATLRSKSDLKSKRKSENNQAVCGISDAGTRAGNGTSQKIKASTKTGRFIGKTPSKIPYTVTVTSPYGADASPPTAAFMKPSESPTTKASKRMTNSSKPLIPTWTAGKSSPRQSRTLFRNSLSMVVR